MQVAGVKGASWSGLSQTLGAINRGIYILRPYDTSNMMFLIDSSISKIGQSGDANAG